MAPPTYSTSVKPIEGCVSKPTCTRRDASKQPASATTCSSTTSDRIQQGTWATSVASVSHSCRAAFVRSVQSAVSKKTNKKAPTAVVPARSGYGDAHAKREYLSMLAHAKAVRNAGLIDEETAKKMCRPWQEKGVLETSWGVEYLLPGVEEKEAIIDLMKAKAIAERKYAAEKKYLEQHFGGGKPAVEKKGDLKSVFPGRIQKQTCSKPPASLPAIIEDDSASSPDPAPIPAFITNLVAQEAVKPLPGLPDYEAYGYHDLVSICFERNFVLGGKAPQLRERFIQYDINVIQDLPREGRPYSK